MFYSSFLIVTNSFPAAKVKGFQFNQAAPKTPRKQQGQENGPEREEEELDSKLATPENFGVLILDRTKCRLDGGNKTHE